MALEYVIGDWVTGVVTHRNFPVTKGTDKVTRDLDGASMELEVALDKLDPSIRENWSSVFKSLARGVILDDTSKAWNDPNAIQAAGMLDKRSAPMGKGFIRLSVVSMNEWLATQVAMDLWDGVLEAPDTTAEGYVEPTYSASTWDGLIRTVLSNLTTASPSGAPAAIQNVVGISPAPAGDRSVPKVDDGTTYIDLLEEIRDKESGIGIEWQWRAQWTSSARDAWQWVLITGTEAQPHINENNVITITLDETSAHKISSFSSSEDSTDRWNKIFLKYQVEDGEETKTVTEAAWDNSDPELPIVAKYVDAGRVLTTSQVAALKAAYLEDGKTGGTQVSFSIEEEWDKTEWNDNIGKTVNFVGVPSTISADHSVTVRAVGIEFSKQKSTVNVTFMPMQSSYPILPKAQKKRKAFTPAERVGWTNTGPKGQVVGIGGGGTPTIPTIPTVPVTPPYAGVDGIFDPSMSYGDVGKNPWENTFPPKSVPTIAFRDFIEEDKTITSYDGDYPIHPYTMCQDTGNRLYGLDKASQSWSTTYDTSGNVTHENGGINPETGDPLNAIQPFYVKKTYMAGGKAGPVETVGVIPVDVILKANPEYTTQVGTENAEYRKGIAVSNWVTNGRFYAAIGIGYRTNNIENFTWNVNSNRKVAVVSTTIDVTTGNLGTSWTDERSDFPNNSFPLTPYISRYGHNVIFSSMFIFPQVATRNQLIQGTTTTFNNYSKSKLSETGWSMGEYWTSCLNIIGDNSQYYATGDLSNGALIKNYADGGAEFYGLMAWGRLNVGGGLDSYGPKGVAQGFDGFNYGGYLYGMNHISFDPYNQPMDSSLTLKRLTMPWKSGEIGESWAGVINSSDTTAYGWTSNPVIILGNIIFELKGYNQPAKIIAKQIQTDGAISSGATIITDSTASFMHLTDSGDRTEYSCFRMETFWSKPVSTTMGASSPGWGSRIFVYDGRIYNFKIKEGTTQGKRDVFSSRSMQAYDPTI